MFIEITNAPRDYAWGRPGAISELLGAPATDAVEAELWLGAHPGSPSRILDPASTAGAADLDAAVRAVPALTVDGRLPFLLKVLAAAAPLSLQAHPSAQEAREGFARENAAGIPLDAPHRNYRDPYPKPELIVAVSPRFEALSGFRTAEAISRDLAELAVAAGRGDDALALLERLRDDAAVGDAFLWVLEGSPQARAIVEAVSAGLEAKVLDHPQLAWIAGLHPGDPGIVGALFLNHVVLHRGEALYLPAGNIHAYLDGVGVELMEASDNVLRGGLTVKHVDVAELGRVLCRSATPPPILEPVAVPGGRDYAPEGAGFALAMFEGDGRVELAGPAIALCLDGGFELAGAVSRARLTRGRAVFVTPDEGAVSVRGAGLVAIAR